MKRKRLVFGCVFAAILSVASIGLLEIVLRTVMGHVLGPVDTRGHVRETSGGSVELTPGFRGTLTIAGRTCELRTNSAGLRGPELEPRRPGERRVLVLGDSMTFGWGVEEDEAFPAVIEGALDRADRPVTVLNGGVPGYGTREIALALERQVSRLDPDVVVACVYVGNDFEDDVVVDKAVVDGFLMARHKAEIATESWRVRFAMACRTWLLVERLWESVFADSGLSRLLERDSAAYREAFADWPEGERRKDCLFMDRSPPGPVQRAAFARVGESLDRMRGLCGERPLVIVVLPTQWHCVPAALAEHALAYHADLGLDPAVHESGRSIDTVGELAAERGLPWVDVRPVLSPDPIRSFIQGDGHFTVTGNRLVGQAIANVVERVLRE